MKVQIKRWDGKKMTLVRETKLTRYEDAYEEAKWMGENHICGSFQFIPENWDDELFLQICERFCSKDYHYARTFEEVVIEVKEE